MPPLVSVSERDRIVTPYHADAFLSMLTTHSLLNTYPDLPHKISHGFPLGDLPPITETYTPPNHFSVDEHIPAILEYFASEVALQRMSGPYTLSEVETILGPFRSSPIQVAIIPGEDGKPDKKRICRNLSFKGSPGISINDMLNSDDFPTRWGTANDAADIVRILPFLSPFLSHYPLSFPCSHPISHDARASSHSLQ